MDHAAGSSLVKLDTAEEEERAIWVRTWPDCVSAGCCCCVGVAGISLHFYASASASTSYHPLAQLLVLGLRANLLAWLHPNLRDLRELGEIPEWRQFGTIKHSVTLAIIHLFPLCSC